MTDPRIEAAARAMFDRSKAEVLAAKGFTSSYDYGEISEKDKEYWRGMIRPIIAAADAAAWRPIASAPDGEVWMRNGKVVALVNKTTRHGEMMYSGWGYACDPIEWQPIPALPGDEVNA